MWVLILLILTGNAFAQRYEKVDNESVKMITESVTEKTITAQEWANQRAALDAQIEELKAKQAAGDEIFSNNGIDWKKVVGTKEALPDKPGPRTAEEAEKAKESTPVSVNAQGNP